MDIGDIIKEIKDSQCEVEVYNYLRKYIFDEFAKERKILLEAKASLVAIRKVNYHHFKSR